jgi:hypothetical protein
MGKAVGQALVRSVLICDLSDGGTFSPPSIAVPALVVIAIPTEEHRELVKGIA